MFYRGPLTDGELAETVRVYREAGNKAAAARKLGIDRASLRKRLSTAAERGLLLDHPPAMPGYRIASVTTHPNGAQSIQQKPEHGEVFAVPEGHRIKGVSALLDPDGREVQKWVKTSEGQLDPLELADTLKKSFEDYAPAALPTPAPETASDILTLVPLADWHIGMFAWGKEVSENWDIKLAEQSIGPAVDDLIARSPSSDQCIILGGGDLLHSDNNQNKTAKSGAVLQVDGRYPKVVEAACRLVVRTIDAALRRHNQVTVRILPGNHDEHSSVAVTYFLSAWYRNEPRVTVDTDPGLFWWYRFGLVLLGATHGHEAKIDRMPGIMAHRRAEDWGVTKFRYVHGFHLHHSAKFATEGQGVISEIHQAPIPQDAWHYGSGFLSGRSLQAITYHEDYGEIGRVRVAMLDGGE